MGELCVPELRHVMALPSVLNYRVWSGGPRSVATLANRRVRPVTRKNLFGPVDHDENLRMVHQELNKMSQEDSQRWNFDFNTETPLPGRYQWEPLAQPQPTTADDPLTTPNPLTTTTLATTSTNPATTSTGATTCLTTTRKGVKRLASSPTGKVKQTLCTDFFRKSSTKARLVCKVDAKCLDGAKHRLAGPECANVRCEDGAAIPTTDDCVGSR